MESQAKLVEELLDRATDFGKTSFELIKLKTLDKTSDIVSSAIPHTVVVTLLLLFLFFINVGLALFIGNLLGNASYGFFIVGAFYGIVGVVIHLFLHAWIKKQICNFIIRTVLK